MNKILILQKIITSELFITTKILQILDITYRFLTNDANTTLVLGIHRCMLLISI
jgi:hypothetical protein